MKVKYEYVNETVEIEVDEKWAAILAEMDKEENLNNRRETRRHEMLNQNIDGTSWLKAAVETPEEIVIRKESAEEIISAMKGLTKLQQEVFIAIHYQGYGVTDYAKKIGIDKSTVCKRLAVAGKKLKKFL